MNFDFASKINPHLEKFDFESALGIAENALKEIPHTIFHFVIDKSLTHHVSNLSDWIDEFYRESILEYDIESLYFEMIEFDINTDTWLIDGFGFTFDGGLEDTNWLCDVKTMTQKPFILEGYEPLQNAFEFHQQTREILRRSNNDAILNSEDYLNSSISRDWCEQIIIIRFMELMYNAHLTSSKKQLNWAKIPVYFTEHEYSFTLKSEHKL